MFNFVFVKTSTKAQIRSIYVRAMDIIHRTPFAQRSTLPVTVAGTTSQTTADAATPVLQHYIEIEQPFKPSATLESKKHNLREAARCINSTLILPGQVFSFWHIVGNPNNKRRFREGRSIHAGVLSIDVGGGLCQASGIIHHLALLAGLQVTERYNHSIDLYTDQTRFAPLGTDATVFYGFKDLRLRNTLPHPIRFELLVEDERIVARLHAPTPLQPVNLHTDIRTDADGTKHVSIQNEQGCVVSTSTYAPLQ